MSEPESTTPASPPSTRNWVLVVACFIWLSLPALSWTAKGLLPTYEERAVALPQVTSLALNLAKPLVLGAVMLLAIPGIIWLWRRPLRSRSTAADLTIGLMGLAFGIVLLALWLPMFKTG